MYILLISVVIGFFLGLYFSYGLIKQYGFDFDDTIVCIIITIASMVVSIFIGAFLSFLLSCIIPTKKETHKLVYQIECVSDGISVEGYSSFGGRGQTNTIMKYRFYYQTINNTIDLYECDVDNSELRYTDGKPYAVIYITKDVKVNNFKDFTNINNWVISNETQSKLQIYVPKNGIRNSTIIDAQ